MAFSFGFAGDDIDSDIDNADDIPQPLKGGHDQAGGAEDDSSLKGEEVLSHSLDEMVSCVRSLALYRYLFLIHFLSTNVENVS